MKYNPVPKMFAVFLFNENITSQGDNKAHGKLLINKVMVTTTNSKIIKNVSLSKFIHTLYVKCNVKIK